MAKSKSFWINFVGVLLILWSFGSLIYFNQTGYSSPGILYITIIGQTLLCLFLVSLAVLSYKNKSQGEFTAYIIMGVFLLATVLYLTFY
ncbi:hypothetical protein D3H55_14235 [Bacillus salacetis]|uniref:DUF3953 domain-containing protein n=1 Tax=Bacillus salacetis TaxID=2315464 RepID=A0A3A1QV29_9BACI|nr:hypothetical protein [Bacillus salacetis]RIW32030.1 hypothetical protein D3H55_14235 [Bacillus salacetis]